MNFCFQNLDGGFLYKVYFEVDSAVIHACMLDNDDIISANTFDVVEKIPTDGKEYYKCCYKLHIKNSKSCLLRHINLSEENCGTHFVLFQNFYRKRRNKLVREQFYPQ